MATLKPPLVRPSVPLSEEPLLADPPEGKLAKVTHTRMCNRTRYYRGETDRADATCTCGYAVVYCTPEEWATRDVVARRSTPNRPR